MLVHELIGGIALQKVADRDLIADFQNTQPLDRAASATTFAFLQRSPIYSRVSGATDMRTTVLLICLESMCR